MTNHIRTEWLAAFIAVVETHSFTDAAQRIHRSQSAVSMQIRQLEAATDQILLLREHKDVVPTEAGERLLPSARRAAAALNDVSTLFNASAQTAGPLRIGVPEEYSGTALPQLLSQFQRNQPMVELLVQCASSDRVETAISTGNLDMGVLVMDNERHQGTPLIYDPTWWVMADTLQLPPEAPLPLVLFDQACWWRQWALDRVHEAGREWRIAYSSDSITGVSAAIQAGLGIGVLGRTTLPTGVSRVPDNIALPDLPGSYLMLRMGNPEAPGAKAMEQLIRQHFVIELAQL